MFVNRNCLETSKYVIMNKSITEEVIYLKGNIVNSSMKFNKHAYKLLNEDLYIKIYGSYITIFDEPGESTSGEFEIKIDANQFNNQPKNIYIQGSKKDDKELILINN